MRKIPGLLWRLVATVGVIASLAIATPAMADNTVNNVAPVGSAFAPNQLARGEMMQRWPNWLETQLSLPWRLDCRGWQGNRSVSVQADDVSLNWSCQHGQERYYAQVCWRQFEMQRGDSLAVRNGQAAVRSRWGFQWVPTCERRPQPKHVFTLSSDSWGPGPQNLQVRMPVTGELNRWTAFNATQHGPMLNLGRGWH